jgi:hypothetical protein
MTTWCEEISESMKALCSDDIAVDEDVLDVLLPMVVVLFLLVFSMCTSYCECESSFFRLAKIAQTG